EHIQLSQYQGKGGYNRQELKYFTLKKLREELKANGLTVTGRKNELIDRLVTHNPEHQKETITELAKDLKNIHFTENVIHHDLYNKFRNVTDTFDYYWNMEEIPFPFIPLENSSSIGNNKIWNY